MPSKSLKQHRLMVAAAADPHFARKAGIPRKVALEFLKADAKSGKFGKRSAKTKSPAKK